MNEAKDSGKIRTLVGLGDLANKSKMKSNIDLDEIEKSLVREGLITTPSISATEVTSQYEQELLDIANRLGMKKEELRLGNAEQAKSEADPRSLPNLQSEPDTQPEEESYEQYSVPIIAEPKKEEGPKLNYVDGSASREAGSDLSRINQEELRKRHLRSVLGSAPQQTSSTRSFNNIIEEEKRQERRERMLNEIMNYTEILELDGSVDMSRLPVISNDSPDDVVESAHRIYKYKANQVKYRGIGNEFVMMGISLLEEVFDGNTVYLGRFRPNLKGYSKVMNAKLSRLAPVTGELTADIVQSVNPSPTFMLAAEILPSMFMYSQRQAEKSQQPAKSVISDKEMSFALNRLAKS